MSAPTISAIYPNDTATGIPVGANIQITFSESVDLSSVKDCVVVYGPDFDQTSGPDSSLWIDDDTGSNPYFLKSPGFTGTVATTMDLQYVTSAGAAISPQPSYTSSAGVGTNLHKLVVTPKSLLKPDTKYTVYIIGDSSDGTSRGVSHRTVWDPDASAVTSATAFAHSAGAYTGTSSDTLNVKVTVGGAIGTAQYKYWWTSDGEGEAVAGRITSRRFRRVDEDSGVQIRFSGSNFVVDDKWTIGVEAKALLATSYSFSFTAGSGAITSVPSTASTSVIGSTTAITSDETVMTVVDMDPDDGATHQKFNNKTITLTFSEELDDATVTDARVTVLAYPVSGKFDDGTLAPSTGEPIELGKKLTVSGKTIKIEL
tara:strand:- start:35942 stop:37054 length:1113 start_codon:yes stop_codon:yes gene_type:complete